MKADAKNDRKPEEALRRSKRAIGHAGEEGSRSPGAGWFWCFMLINGTLGQARVIPSGSMENTLLVGDHLIMSRIGYDAGVPFTNWHVSAVAESAAPADRDLPAALRSQASRT